MSIYDRMKNQPLMRMQEGGQAMTPEQQALLDKYVQESTNNFLGGTYTTPQIDLGGGLGAIPGVNLNMQDILAQLPQNQMFGIGNIDFSNLPGAPSTTPEIPLETLLASVPEDFQFDVPEGVDLTDLNPTIFGNELPSEASILENSGVLDEVETIAPVMPAAPVSDPVVQVVSEEVADEIVADPVADPVVVAPPVVDTSGIGTLPQVVLPPADAEDMDLITGTDAPLTEEEIVDVATPTMTPTTGNDIAALNQQYNDTFLKFLVQDPVAPVGPPQIQPVYGPGTNQGDQSGLLGGETISRYAQNPNSSYISPGITGSGVGGASMQDMFNNYGNYQQTYSTPADVQFQMDSIFGNGFTNNNNINNSNQNFNNPYEQYGNLAFPTFGSGVTSLVPPDTMYNLK